MSNSLKYFDNALNKYYPDSSDTLKKQFRENYIRIKPDVLFAKTSPNPMDKRIDFAAQFLALVQAMHNNGETHDKIREVSISVAKDYVTPRSYFGRQLKKLPVQLIRTKFGEWLISIFKKRVAKASHPDGFAANIITDKTLTGGLGYGVDIIECGICKLFNKHRLPQYSSILCEVDYITTGLAGLEMKRTGTIATGSDKCDFRYAIKKRVD